VWLCSLPSSITRSWGGWHIDGCAPFGCACPCRKLSARWPDETCSTKRRGKPAKAANAKVRGWEKGLTGKNGTTFNRCYLSQSRRSASFLISFIVVKTLVTTIFSVEPTDYGWSVSDGAMRLGLFVSQRQALDDVRKRRAVLKAEGCASAVEVTGEETEGARTRPPRFY